MKVGDICEIVYRDVDGSFKKTYGKIMDGSHILLKNGIYGQMLIKDNRVVSIFSSDDVTLGFERPIPFVANFPVYKMVRINNSNKKGDKK